MNKRGEHNIGESNHTSVKVSNNPGGKSNWSFGWDQGQKKKTEQKPGFINKYHNESQLSFGDNSKQLEEEQKRKQEERRKKEEEINNKLPTYDPKNGSKSNICFGTEKTDYRKKDEVFTSVKVHNPPGGRSNIQFG